MTHRALLIGSQILGLEGPHHDVAAMKAALATYGFAAAHITTLTAGATRQAIVEAYEQLIAQTATGDVVVVYYSGHGGFAHNALNQRVQYIIPTDWDESGRTFVGITDAELSELLAQLTDRTRNAITVFDCCHSAMISRGMAPRVVPGVWTRALARHVETHTPERRYPAGNPYAVRLVATEADREAFEADQLVDGGLRRRGYFTRALEQILAEPDAAALSWRTIIDRVREQVLAVVRSQRPSVEGPADRVLFTTTELARPDAVVYFERDGEPALRASRILGARVDAIYKIARRGATALSPATEIATAKVTRLDGSTAYVELTDCKEPPEVGSLGYPTITPFSRLTAAIRTGSSSSLETMLTKNPMIELAKPDDARFTIDVANGELVLTDWDVPDLPSIFRYQDNDAKRDLVVRQIARWAKAEALRTLKPWNLSADAVLEVTWGAVVGNQLDLRRAGDPFRDGERICVRAKNVGQRALYMWIFDIGITGKVSLLTIDNLGLRIEPGRTLAVGEDNGVLRGLEMSWPQEFDRTVGHRTESVMVLASTHPTDVSVFETPALTRGRGLNNNLADLLRSMGVGAARDIKSDVTDQSYAVFRIDFPFHAEPAS